MQTDRPSLRSNFAWTFAGNTVHGASQWVVLSLIAKLGTTEMLGEYALAVAATTPVAMLTHLNLRAVLATDIHEHHPFADYMRVRVMSTAAALACITVLAGFIAHGWHLAGAIFLVGVSLVVENISDLYYGVMQRRERMDLIATSMIGRAVLSIVLVGVCLWATGSLLGAAAGLACSRLLTMLLYDRPKAKPPRHEPLSAPIQVFRTALPLGVVLMLISLNTNMPRYAIERALGTRDLGAFAAVASFVTIGAMLVNALGQSATTRLAQHFGGGNRAEFRRLGTKLVGVSVALGAIGVLVAVVAGGPVLAIAYRPEYRTYKDLLVMVLAAGTISYAAAMLGYLITATRAFFAQMPLLAMVAGTCALGSWVLVPRMGLSGAALALGIASGVQIIGQLFILRRTR